MVLEELKVSSSGMQSTFFETAGHCPGAHQLGTESLRSRPSFFVSSFFSESSSSQVSYLEKTYMNMEADPYSRLVSF